MNTFELTVLGGAEEIGANSSYLNLDGTGLVIDAGLHPRKSDENMFPDYDILTERDVDYLLLTHAHTDHIGSLPYLLEKFPYLQILATRATRDVCAMMLRDTVKVIRKKGYTLSEAVLQAYNRDTIATIDQLIEGKRYEEPEIILGERGRQPVTATWYDAGHILGSSGIMLECGGRSIFHTGDVQFRDQALLPKASFPRHHVDCLIMESTHGADGRAYDYDAEKQRLADFINQVANSGGSILIPAFALGKTQEVLRIIYGMMQKGVIPVLPITTGGLGKKLSSLYDRYAYTVPRVERGFKLTRIPQNPINYEKMMRGDYFSTPSIVIISSGMLHEGTIAYRLALKWMQRKNFGIAMVGYQDPDAPGHALVNSPRNKAFDFMGTEIQRKCYMKHFRFSAHATREQLIDFAVDVRPKNLFLVHGDIDAIQELAALIRPHLPQTNIVVPNKSKSYTVQFD